MINVKFLYKALCDNEKLKQENQRLASELECTKRNVEEISKIMRANCLQKELLNDIHVSTLKVCTVDSLLSFFT